MPPALTAPESIKAHELLFDDMEIDDDTILLECLRREFEDDDELIDAFVNDYLEFDLPQIDEEDMEGKDDDDPDIAREQEEKFDREAIIAKQRGGERMAAFPKKKKILILIASFKR